MDYGWNQLTRWLYLSNEEAYVHASSLNSVPEKYPAVRLAHEADENIEESGPVDSISECTDTVHCCKFLYKFIMLYVVLYNRHVCLLF